jgi:hypothetical protein
MLWTLFNTGPKVCKPVTEDIAAISEVVQSGACESYRKRESLPWSYKGTIIEHSFRNRRRSNQIKIIHLLNATLA